MKDADSTHHPLSDTQLDNKRSTNKRIDQWSQQLQQVGLTQDRHAFALIFEHFSPLIKGYCLSRPVPNQPATLGEELVQEVMIKIWQKAASFNPEKASASTWIFTMARNCRIDLLRRNNKHINDSLDADDIWMLEDDSTPVQDVQSLRDEERLKSAFEYLPSDQKHILSKVYMEGKTHLEAAQEMSLPLGTVKSRVRLALKKLQVWMPSENREAEV